MIEKAIGYRLDEKNEQKYKACVEAYTRFVMEYFFWQDDKALKLVVEVH